MIPKMQPVSKFLMTQPLHIDKEYKKVFVVIWKSESLEQPAH